MKFLRSVGEWLVNLFFFVILEVAFCGWVYLLVRLLRFVVRATFN